MLKPSILYKTALEAERAKASQDPTNKYYTDVYWAWGTAPDPTNWERHQYVSVDTSDNLVGYIAVSIDRGCRFVYALSALRFDKSSKYDIMFARDFRKFFLDMFTRYNYNKIDFDVCVGSPHEAMYDKFIKKFNGRIVGTKKNHWVLEDGTFCDIKMYELSREEFLGVWNK